MFQMSSHDGGGYVFIDDLNKLDTFTPTGKTGNFTKQDIQEVKEVIEFAINKPNDSKTWGTGVYNQFGVYEGQVWDEKGYFIFNILSDCYGFTKPPFNIDHVVCSQSYL